MAKYKFSHLDSVRGGKIRSAQAAQERRISPTCLEKRVRDILTANGITFFSEYPVETMPGVTQYFDIFIPDQNIAIEVDGSLRWHDPKYLTSKMAKYDHIKANFAFDNGIKIIRVQETDIDTFMEKIK